MYDPNAELDTVTRLLGLLYAHSVEDTELGKEAITLAMLLMKQITKQYED